MNDDKQKENDTDDELIEEEFEGVKSNIDRSVVVDFGLPLDVGNISPTEFDVSGEEKTRAVGALDISSNSQQISNGEFDVGANFQASQSLFASTSAAAAVSTKKNVVAPILPFYLRTAKTSFQSKKSISVLMPELEHALQSSSAYFTVDENSPCIYACSILVNVALVQFEVRIFATESKEHLIEFRHLAGCRDSFADAYTQISKPFVGSDALKNPMPRVVLPLLTDDFVMPSLAPSLSPSAVVDFEMEMVSEGADMPSMIEGVRGIASMGNHHVDMFADEGFGLPLADRMTELASSKTSNDELRGVAMSAVGQLAAMEHISMNWLNSTVDTIVAGVKDDDYHVRREALRSLEIVSKRHCTLAAKFVRAGAVPLLEIEASGGSDDQPKDFPAQGFAQGALNACRA